MKRLSLLAIGMFVGMLSFAQRTSFGLKGGLNVGNFKDAGTSNTDTRLGFHLGALAHIHATHMLAIQPEVVFSTQGAKYPGQGTFKADYVNVPVLLQYLAGRGLRLETGPQLGFLAGSKWQAENSSTEHDITSTVKSTDVSWAFGLGYLSTSGLGIDARYNVGLSNIHTIGYDIKNRVLQIGVFYQFHQ